MPQLNNKQSVFMHFQMKMLAFNSTAAAPNCHFILTVNGTAM